MPEVIVFPDAVALLRAYLLGIPAVTALAPIITAEVPRPAPEVFIQMSRVGGLIRNRVVDQAAITVDCWAATQASATTVAQLVRAHLHALEGTVLAGTAVYGVSEVGGPADFPDPDSAAARVRQTFEIGLRGQPQ